jgi:hypothetical protein
MRILPPVATNGTDAPERMAHHAMLPAGCAMTAFLGAAISKVEGMPDGTLTLDFNNAGRVTVYDDSKQYESYQTTMPLGTIIV